MPPLENFRHLLKGSTEGILVAVDAPDLGSDVDEQVFRSNERKLNDAQRFAVGIVGKRWMFKTLISVDSNEDSAN